MARKLTPIALMLAAACTAPAADEEDPATANRPATVEVVAEAPAPQQAGSDIKLARLPDSRMGDAATTAGVLETDGYCLYLRTGPSTRHLIASTMPGARWDAEQEALVIPQPGGGTFRLGERIALGGSEAGAGTLAGQWVEPPAAVCDTSRAWVTNKVSAAGEG